MTSHDTNLTALDAVTDSSQHQFDGVADTNLTPDDVSLDTEIAVSEISETREIFSVPQVSDALNVSRGTVYGYLNKYRSKAEFKLSVLLIGEEKFYPLEQWVKLLSSTRTKKFPDGLEFPESLLNPQPQSSPTTPEVNDSAKAEPIESMAIHTGNHRSALALPETPSELNLGDYRGNASLSSFEDDDIDRFLDACDGFLEATEADYHKQIAVTERKRERLGQVKAKVEQVKSAKERYQTRSETISLINQSLDAEIGASMQVLGKPATASPGVPASQSSQSS